MFEAISYFYNIELKEIIKRKYYYKIIAKNKEIYYLKEYERNPKEEKMIENLNQNLLINNILVHKLIKNKNNNIVTIINQKPYYMYKTYINKDKKVNLSEISYLSNQKIAYDKSLIRYDWSILWENKIDYLENQINEIGHKYPLLVDSFNYFVGMTENAISYVKMTNKIYEKTIYDNLVISHRKINVNQTFLEFYDTTSFIVDHKSRDVAEYIKNSFFENNRNIFNELNEYFKNNIYSIYGISLLFARIMYPSFYFDMYDKIINNEKEEKEIGTIIKRIKDYEIYIKNIFLYLKKIYNIKEINWITKKRIN